MAATDLDKLVFYTNPDDLGLLALESPTTQIGANSTSAVAAVSIGFTFNFDGVANTVCEVRANGSLHIAAGAASNASMFASNTYPLIAPWYDALKTAITTGYVKTETQGTVPWRRFVVEWNCYANSAETAIANTTLQFQCVLYETLDKHEFRYAAAVVTGAPADVSSAEVGVKGDTSVVTDNYRDRYTDLRTLGASNTTTAQFDLDGYDALVAGGTVCAEPAWPMCGRAFLLAPDTLTGHGIFGGNNDPIWTIANFVNWLWCRHTPALINIAPYQQTGYASVTYVVPCQPSDEGLAYTAHVIVYASTGANCTVTTDVDAAADPQPATGADWTNADTEVQAVSAGWNELTAFAVPIATTATYIRITVAVSAGTVIVGSAMLVPASLDDVDEGLTTTSLTGFKPMSIAQFRQRGAPIHAEWFNRAWRGIAVVVNDRRQMVWSSVWPELSLVSIAKTTAKPVRTIGVSKACLPKRGQECVARVYARDTTGGAKLQVSEQGNALLAEWTVAASGGEYRAQSTTVDLFSQEPAITATCAPVGTMSPMFVGLEWSPAMSTDNLFQGVTPAPSLAKLFALAARMEQALRAYCYAGNATMLARGKTSSNPWYVQTWVPPAVYALHARIARDADDHTAASLVTSIFGVTSGAAPADEIRADSPHSSGRDDYPPEGAIGFGTTSGEYNAAPIAAGYRPLESPTATTMANGVRERVTVVRGVGITFVPVLADAASL